MRGKLLRRFEIERLESVVTYTSPILLPLSLIYTLISRLRLDLYRRGFVSSRKLDIPVISIGNLTVGGTGKTPLVHYVARGLAKRGHRPAVLSRGYGRRGRKIKRIDGPSPETAWNVVGDEPLWLARSLGDIPVFVGADRCRAGRLATAAGATVAVMDDGFQHLGLMRDLNIVLVDSTNPWGNGRVLPAGPLREPLQGIKRADVAMLTRVNQCPHPERLLAEIGQMTTVPILNTWFQLTRCHDLATGCAVELSALSDRRLFALSGVGNPRSFERTVADIGGEFVGSMRFSDHFPYTIDHISEALAEARKAGADYVVTTEKDGVRIPRDGLIHPPLVTLGIEIVIEQEDDFWRMIENTLWRTS